MYGLIAQNTILNRLFPPYIMKLYIGGKTASYYQLEKVGKIS